VFSSFDLLTIAINVSILATPDHLHKNWLMNIGIVCSLVLNSLRGGTKLINAKPEWRFASLTGLAGACCCG